MNLEAQLIKGFKEQVGELGYALIQEDELFIATGNEIYLSLEIIKEHFGMSKVVFAQVTIIIGNYQKALGDHILNPDLKEKIIELKNSSFNICSVEPMLNLKNETLKKIEDFKALNSKFYSETEYTFFQQKGTHDLILQDPLFIQALRGKKRLTNIIEQLKQINLPNGWLIQKPKGLGKDNVIKGWKTVGKALVFFSIVWILFKMYLSFA